MLKQALVRNLNKRFLYSAHQREPIAIFWGWLIDVIDGKG